MLYVYWEIDVIGILDVDLELMVVVVLVWYLLYVILCLYDDGWVCLCECV